MSSGEIVEYIFVEVVFSLVGVKHNVVVVVDFIQSYQNVVTQTGLNGDVPPASYTTNNNFTRNHQSQ